MLAVILVIAVGTIRLIGSNANTVFSQAASSIQSPARMRIRQVPHYESQARKSQLGASHRACTGTGY